MSRLIHPFIATLIILLFGAMEGALYPVIRLWSPQNTIILQDLDGRSMHLAGFVHKVRSCKLVGVQAEAEDGEQLQVTFMDSYIDQAKAHPTGSQAWGPWKVKLKPFTQSVEFYSIHDCHPIWTTKTYLGEVLVIQ